MPKVTGPESSGTMTPLPASAPSSVRMNIERTHSNWSGSRAAVPPLDQDHADLDEGLFGIHAGLDLIRAGFRLLALERLTADQTQTIIAALAGSEDSDVLGLLNATVKRLTDPAMNPALHGISERRVQRAQSLAEVFDHLVAVSGLRGIGSETSRALDLYVPEPDAL